MTEFISNNFIPIIGILMMLAIIAKNNRLPKLRRIYFYLTLASFALSLFFRNADYITSNYETFTVRRAVYSAFGYVFRTLLIYFTLGTDLDLSKPKTRKIYILIGLPILVTIFAAFSVFFTDKVYSFVPPNSFFAGPYSWLNYVSLVFYLFVFIYIAAKDFIKYKNHRHGTMISAVLVLMIFAMLFEKFGYRAFMCENAMTMALMLYLIFFQNNDFQHQRRSLEHKARIDALTGLYNRTGYNYLVEALSKEKDLMIGLLVLDIDNFKSINDTYGHETGDVILKKVADLLKVAFRSTDYVIRHGGDEFAVIMVGITDNLAFVVKNKIESLNVQLENPIDNVPKTSVSAGLAFSENGFTSDLFNRADKALYHVKETTRRDCALYEELPE